MMGSFLTRALLMVLGYAYPAYECYKTVELNRPEIEQLRFWCQYWILVALLTVFERVGDAFVSWLPMYSEAKLAFFVYLWYPKTRGTSYVYNTFFRPYIAKHETEIDRNLFELRTRAGDIVVSYWKKAACYGETRIFEVLQYVASQSQSQSQSSQRRPVQIRQTAPASPAPHPGGSHQSQQPMHPPSSPTKKQQQQQESTKAGASTPAAPVVAPQLTSSTPAALVPPQQNSSPSSENANPSPQETHMEEAIRVTRGRMRKQSSLGRPPSH